MILVDTSILIDHLRGHEGAHRSLRWAIHSRQRLTASVPTKVEILAGMRASEEGATYALLSLLEWIAVDEEIADVAGQLARRYFKSHPGIDPVDFVIAATAQHLNAQLWTRNSKHFPMFSDLPEPYHG